MIPFAYYLALIVDDKKLALNFANYYNYRIHERKVLCIDMSLDEFSEYVEIAKMYVAVHEQTHFKYENDKVQKAFDLKNIEDMLDIVHRLYENYDESYCKEKYLKSKSELLERESRLCGLPFILQGNIHSTYRTESTEERSVNKYCNVQYFL